jgi:MFS family permease
MTRFALIIWAFQQDGSATTIALMGFFAFVPFVVTSPFAGVLVDRWPRRTVLILSDLGAALTTTLLLVFMAMGELEIWHLFMAEALTGFFDAFQVPAYDAAITQLIPKKHYSRASGMRSLAFSGADVAAPVLAGALLALISIRGVLIVDLVTFMVALGTLLIIRIPDLPAEEVQSEQSVSTWQQVQFGFRFILERRGLFGLMLIMAAINLIGSLTYLALLPTMVLARSGGDELSLAAVQSALGIGGVVGGLVLSAWGGPRRRLDGVLIGAAISFLAGDFLLGTGQTQTVWIIGAFVAAIFIPIILGMDRAIWQSKVPPRLQGRIFATHGMVRRVTIPLGYLLAGPLADWVFEPAMASGGWLADTFGPLVGVGPGAGMGLMFVCTALIGCTISLSGYLYPALRRVDMDLPDHDFVPAG